MVCKQVGICGGGGRKGKAPPFITSALDVCKSDSFNRCQYLLNKTRNSNRLLKVTDVSNNVPSVVLLLLLLSSTVAVLLAAAVNVKQSNNTPMEAQ